VGTWRYPAWIRISTDYDESESIAIGSNPDAGRLGYFWDSEYAVEVANQPAIPFTIK